MRMEKYFDPVLSLLDEGVLITDRHGNQVYVNKTYEELTGVGRESMVGKTARELQEAGFFDVILNPEVVHTGKPITRIQTLRDGRKVVLNANPVFDADGKVDMVVTFMRDITAITRIREQLSAQQELLKTFQNLQGKQEQTRFGAPVVMNSSVMQTFFTKLLMAADSGVTVLLMGETGTGKDIFARKLFMCSPRAEKPFIKADCSSIPENLIETELFGYTPGSFSGASPKGKIGLIEAASGGTLFLDEIGELPMQMQSRLLRVLQDREIVRVGSVEARHVDVRFIVATNKDLENEVQKGKFRSDLYYRLNVSVFKIPPLRERREDIVPLAHAFLGFYCERYRRTLTLTSAAEKALECHSWPGNVRELENMMQGLVVSHDKRTLDVKDLPLPRLWRAEHSRHSIEENDIPADMLERRSLKEIMSTFEERVLRQSVRCFKSMAELCARLKIDRTTAFRKMRRYGIK